VFLSTVSVIYRTAYVLDHSADDAVEGAWFDVVPEINQATSICDELHVD
jgi:hypothetical protein